VIYLARWPQQLPSKTISLLQRDLHSKDPRRIKFRYNNCSERQQR
jgi:hypothetical protein